MDEIIGKVYDKSGKKIDVGMTECFQTVYIMTKLLYVDFMSRVIDGNFELFKKKQMDSIERMIHLIHDRYADHVEGLRMEIFDDNNLKDPNKDVIDG